MNLKTRISFVVLNVRLQWKKVLIVASRLYALIYFALSLREQGTTNHCSL